MAKATKATSAGDVAEVRRLRRQAKEMLEDMLSMSGTLAIMLDDEDRLSSYVWLDAREEKRLAWVRENIPVLDGQIRRFMEQREGLLARAREIETGQKGRAA